MEGGAKPAPEVASIGSVAFHLFDPPGVPTTFEAGREEHFEDRQRQLRRRDSLPQAQHVGRVVLPRQARLNLQDRVDRANASKPVRSHADAYAASAHQHTPLRLAPSHASRDASRVIWIVDAVLGGGPQVFDVVAELPSVLHQSGF